MFCVVTKIMALFTHLLVFLSQMRKFVSPFCYLSTPNHSRELNPSLSVEELATKLLDLVPVLEIPALSLTGEFSPYSLLCILRVHMVESEDTWISLVIPTLNAIFTQGLLA